VTDKLRECRPEGSFVWCPRPAGIVHVIRACQTAKPVRARVLARTCRQFSHRPRTVAFLSSSRRPPLLLAPRRQPPFACIPSLRIGHVRKPGACVFGTQIEPCTGTTSPHPLPPGLSRSTMPHPPTTLPTRGILRLRRTPADPILLLLLRYAFLAVGPRALEEGCPQMARVLATVDCARVIARSLPNWFPEPRGVDTRKTCAAGCPTADRQLACLEIPLCWKRRTPRLGRAAELTAVGERRLRLMIVHQDLIVLLKGSSLLEARIAPSVTIKMWIRMVKTTRAAWRARTSGLWTAWTCRQ